MQTSTLPNLKKLSAKDLQTQIQISESTAKKLLSDIRTEFCIKFVTQHHLQKYLKV